jgi:hypothetical protein
MSEQDDDHNGYDDEPFEQNAIQHETVQPFQFVQSIPKYYKGYLGSIGPVDTSGTIQSIHHNDAIQSAKLQTDAITLKRLNSMSSPCGQNLRLSGNSPW